jgi:hypothetical protein
LSRAVALIRLLAFVLPGGRRCRLALHRSM